MESDILPYKNRNIQLNYLKEWREDHKENIQWDYKVWVENNRDKRYEINKRYEEKNKDYINALKRLKRKLNGVETK
jgi:hypothetical protein